MDEIKAYYDALFKQSEVTGSIYEPMTPLLEAAHIHRMAVLDALPIGSLETKTVVDFGTGSWGFGCIYPRLHACKLAIGMDISAEAVRISELVSQKGDFAYGKRYKYYVSDGLSIPLADASVDLLFTGECIEHVENTDAFLDEIYRVLSPGGILILTTPNPKPVLFRALGDSYAVGPEHIALMTYGELTSYLQPRFEISAAKGYNSSVHTLIDSNVNDVELAKRWACAYEDSPEDACGFIIMARKKDGWSPRKYTRTTYFCSDETIQREGEWKLVNLHHTLKGVQGKAGSGLSITFTGETLVCLLWVHEWSGKVDVSVDGACQTIDLFEHVGGFRRIVLNNLDLASQHLVTIRPTGQKNSRSFDDQVIFFSAAAYAFKEEK